MIPILRVKSAAEAVEWYGRIGFEQESVHRFAPHMRAFVTVRRGTIKLFLSEHTGDARPDTLVYLALSDLRPVAAEFGVEPEECP